MPAECGVTKVEPEGLAVVVYIKNIDAFYKNTSLIKVYGKINNVPNCEGIESISLT